MKRFENGKNGNQNTLREQNPAAPANSSVLLDEEELEQVSGGVSGLTNRRNETEKQYF